jgi:hypothetical protein
MSGMSAGVMIHTAQGRSVERDADGRRFNAAFRAVYHKPPTAVRRARRPRGFARKGAEP